MALEEEDEVEIKLTSDEDSCEVNIKIKTSTAMNHQDLIIILENYIAELNMDYYQDSHGSKDLH
jgi:hypothetical protein